MVACNHADCLVQVARATILLNPIGDGLGLTAGTMNALFRNPKKVRISQSPRGGLETGLTPPSLYARLTARQRSAGHTTLPDPPSYSAYLSLIHFSARFHFSIRFPGARRERFFLDAAPG